MPINLTKKYPQLLEVGHYTPHQRKGSLYAVFKRDIEDHPNFLFNSKKIRPTKKEGESPMQTLFGHLTTRDNKDENGKKTGGRSFEMARSIRIHWITPIIEKKIFEGIKIFSYEDRVKGKDVIRTYIFDTNQDYVIILEPQRSNQDYYLLTAYHLNEPGGKKQIKKKLKKKLDQVY